MKYIILVIIVVLGGLLFINKDRFLSADMNTNTATVLSTDIVEDSIKPPFSKANTVTTKNQSNMSAMSSSIGYYTWNTYATVNGSEPFLTWTGKFPAGTSVKQSVGPDDKIYKFVNFGGDCSNIRLRGNCVLTMNSDKNIIINWDAKTYNLKVLQQVAKAKIVNKNDPKEKIKYVTLRGGGTISGKSGDYISGETIILTANPDSNSQVFWSGACSGSKNICKIKKINSNKEVVYVFIPKIASGCKISGLGIVCNWPGDKGPEVYQ